MKEQQQSTDANPLIPTMKPSLERQGALVSLPIEKSSIAITMKEQQQQSTDATPLVPTEKPSLKRQGALVSLPVEESSIASVKRIARDKKFQTAIVISLAVLTTICFRGSVPLYVTFVWFVIGAYTGRNLLPSSAAAITINEHGSGERRALPQFARPVSNSFNQGEQKPVRPIPVVTQKKEPGWKDLFLWGRKAKKTSGEQSEISSIENDWYASSFHQSTYTTLNDATERANSHWEKRVHDKPSREMTARLLTCDDFTTKRCEPFSGAAAGALGEGTLKNGMAQAAEKEEDGDGKFGTFDTDNMHASVMQKAISAREIDPLFKLRGMDIFRSVGCPEDEMWRQPILNKNGLRDVPTFLVNIMLPWANLVLYFEMPNWVERFDDIPEEREDDSEDVKALKRFLRGDEEYRRPRWKILAYVIDGPWIVRSMAPPTEEIVFDFSDWLRLTWHERNQSIDEKTGKKRAALLEVDVDMMGDLAVRKILSVVQGSVAKVKVDCACIISKPETSEIEEPSACIGLWRMDRIDMRKTSLAPEKDKRLLLQEASAMFSARQLQRCE